MKAVEKLLNQLTERAMATGFDVIGITSAKLPAVAGERLEAFVAAGRHGAMTWMKETLSRRKSPTAMWPQARSAIVLGLNYGPHENPLERQKNKTCGNISVYALNRDYHDIVKGRLKQLAGWFAAKSGADVKVFVDTAPLMEKPLARQAAIGWQGKHTNLVSRQFGSWLFLGVILTTADLPAASPHDDGCGTCRACIDICPTRAIFAPFQLDARLCISWLTIEFDGHVPAALRPLMGNRIYGCDDCLAVCPWNKFAKDCREQKLLARPELVKPDLAMLAGLDDGQFRKLFSGSPVKRTGRNRFVRNVLIAIGNSGEPALAGAAIALLQDDCEQVRAMAVWAALQLLEKDAFDRLRAKHMAGETARAVLDEWRANGQ